MKYLEKYSWVIFIIFIISSYLKPAICFLILGLISFELGIGSILILKKMKHSGVKSEGTILAYGNDKKRYKTPLIEFLSDNGDLIKGKPFAYATSDLSKITSKKYNTMIGKKVIILYDPLEPKKFVIEEEEGPSCLVFIFFVLIGLLFIGLGIASLLGYIKIEL